MRALFNFWSFTEVFSSIYKKISKVLCFPIVDKRGLFKDK